MAIPPKALNIGMVLTGRDFPPDIRVEKEARSLLAAGHSMHLLCEVRERGRKERETVDGIKVCRVQVDARIKAIRDRLRYYRSGVDANWLRAIIAFAQEESIDVLHVHDLVHALTTIAAGRACHIPVVFDMHEDMPAAFDMDASVLSRQSTPMLFIKRTLLSLVYGTGTTWLRKMERRAFEQCDHVIVVVDESKERLVNMGVPSEKITVVMNCEDSEHFANQPINGVLVDQFRGRFVVSYIGGMEAVRGLETLIESMTIVRAQAPSAILLLVGDGYMRPRLEELVGELGLQDHVVFTGWVDFSLVPAYVSASTVCVIPHRVVAHTDTTIPHKLFQYMLMGKPVAATPVPPIKRILEETGAGVVANGETPAALAEAILQAADPARAKLLGENGQRATAGRYNWATEAVKLLDVYRGWR